MKEIARSRYLAKLESRRENGLVKILTGMRGCGKSYLLDPIFRRALVASGVPEDHILKVDLEREENMRYWHDPGAFCAFIRSFLKNDAGMHYLLLDEIQRVDEFEFVLNGLLHERNADVYVTGSSARFLSKDVITEFRGRGDEVRVRPLTFEEFLGGREGDRGGALGEYLAYGGMPLVLSKETNEEKAAYLKDLLEETCFPEIAGRYGIRRKDALGATADILAASIGSPTNPLRIHEAFRKSGGAGLAPNTVSSALASLEDAFVVEKAARFDIRRRKRIGTPAKYYFTDLGLRNARLGFRGRDELRLMENLVFNELQGRGFEVAVGAVEARERNGSRKLEEIDFVCDKGSRRYYIQTALCLEDREKTAEVSEPLLRVRDSFRKIIVVRQQWMRPWHTEDGILVLALSDFLLDPKSIDF